MQELSHKIKLLKLWELLQQESDEQHPLLATDICERLHQQSVACDRRTLTKDIRTLEEFGYEVFSTFVRHEKAYYVVDRRFDVPELKILIDAVQAASFITEKKTEELIGKIASLAGSHRSEILKNHIVSFNTRKHRNETVYYTVDRLEEAIEQNKKVIFRYFNLNENGERVYRREGHHYVAEPIALVFHEDNYYLISYSAKHDNTTNYRVDRMDAVEITDDDVCEKAQELRNSVAGYTEQTFKMYGGPSVDLILQFDNELIGAVYDKFGEGIKMLRANGKQCAAGVKVQISPTFWGWLFQFGNKMQIILPPEVEREYRKKIAEAIM